jgi:hypothetical protein
VYAPNVSASAIDAAAATRRLLFGFTSEV